jgi:hypothetical protein
VSENTRLVGVDLGQQRDWTAISVTERVEDPGGVEYRVRHLDRPPLGTPYPQVVERVVGLIRQLGGWPVLAVDATGVGRPVVDMLRTALEEGLRGTRTRVSPCWVTITGGDVVSRTPGGGLRVPKRDLISATLVLLQNGQLKIAEGLALKDTLVRELLSFRVKINISTSHDSYEAWREGDHDDLVLSVALACWAGERFMRRRVTVVAKPKGF